MDMKRCIIFTAGEAGSLTKESLLLQPEDFIICCDAGYCLASSWGIEPDLLLGDFDSYTGPLPEDIPIRRFVRDKDDTDTMLAVRTALEQAFDAIVLVAATGGRLDHTLGNLQILAMIGREAPQVSAEILGGHERIWLVGAGHTCTLSGTPEQTFSVLCHSDTMEVSIAGAVFPLDHGVMTNCFPLGISNRMGAGGTAQVTIHRGMAFVILPDPKTI